MVNSLVPNSTTPIEFTDTQGLPTRITFPEGLGEQQAIVTPLLALEPGGYLSAGHTFDIALATASTTGETDVIGVAVAEHEASDVLELATDLRQLHQQLTPMTGHAGVVSSM